METQLQSLYLPELEQNSIPGVYAKLIESAKASGSGEHPKIWNLFAFRQDFTIHMARFTQGVLRAPSSLSPALRELIAAYTSYRNECAFCTNAHAAAAAELLGDESLVWSALRDLESSPLEEKDKALLRFAARITDQLPSFTAADVEAVRAAGWNDEAIYFAITTTALFNFYNRWITSSGVPPMSAEAHTKQGKALAHHGYVRDPA